MKISHEGRILELGDKRVELDQEILRVHQVGPVIIVIYDDEAMPREIPLINRNVVALNPDGEIVWTIEQSRNVYATGDLNDQTIVANPFVSLGVLDGGRVVVCDLGGLTYDLDIETGKLSNPIFTQ
jgi:outer membrane protein assembly factor BamB